MDKLNDFERGYQSGFKDGYEQARQELSRADKQDSSEEKLTQELADQVGLPAGSIAKVFRSADGEVIGVLPTML